jgi:hypothetical protein
VEKRTARTALDEEKVEEFRNRIHNPTPDIIRKVLETVCCESNGLVCVC